MRHRQIFTDLGACFFLLDRRGIGTGAKEMVTAVIELEPSQWPGCVDEGT
jgi:hypothetical protein